MTKVPYFGRPILGVQFNRLLEFSYGVVDLALHRERQAQVVVCVRIFRVALEREIVLFDCLIHASSGGECKAQIVVRLGVVRIDGKSLFVLLDRLWNPSLLGKHVAQVAVRLGKARIGLDGELEAFDGFTRMARTR